MTPTISLIIPVYKVEPYLARCLDSVLAQSYRALEILLVDDGSPDGCPALCDAYARRDPRVRVLHRPNLGLSAARNAGLDAARGGYIGFVDADDFLDPDLFRRLYHALRRAEAEIAVCAFAYTDEHGGFGGLAGPAQGRVLGRDDGLRLLLEDGELQNHVWNKLFAAALWEGVRFPVGKTFEDIATTWRLFARARRVALLPWPGYAYRVRANSIVQSRALPNEIDCANAGLDRYEALAGRYPECEAVMAAGVLHSIVTVWGLVWEERRAVRERYRRDMERFAAFAKPRMGAFAAAQRLGVTGRLTMRLIPHPTPLSYLAARGLNRLYVQAHPPRAQRPAPARPFPRLSVIPTGPEAAAELLAALSARHDWELLLADDGASPALSALFARLARRDGRVRRLRCGPGEALREAAEAAMGTYLLFADGAAALSAGAAEDGPWAGALGACLAGRQPLPEALRNVPLRRAALEAAGALFPAPAREGTP